MPFIWGPQWSIGLERFAVALPGCQQLETRLITIFWTRKFANFNVKNGLQGVPLRGNLIREVFKIVLHFSKLSGL